MNHGVPGEPVFASVRVANAGFVFSGKELPVEKNHKAATDEAERALYRQQPALTYKPMARELATRWWARRQRRAWMQYCQTSREVGAR